MILEVLLNQILSPMGNSAATIKVKDDDATPVFSGYLDVERVTRDQDGNIVLHVDST